MTYKQRNSLVLAAQLVIVLAAGAYATLVHFPKAQGRLRQELAGSEASAGRQPALQEEKARLETKIASLGAQLGEYHRRLEPVTGSTEIIRRIDRAQSLGTLKFTLAAQGVGRTGPYSWQGFKLSGEGSYQSVFGLVWLLEGGPELIAVERLDFRGSEAADSDGVHLTVPFDMVVRVIYSEIPSTIPQTDRAELAAVPSSANVFYPLITANLPPNSDGLLEIERAELRALLNGRAVLMGPEGRLLTLSVGDPVYLGRLSAIDTKANRAIFQLNKGGIFERRELSLSFEGPNSSEARQ